MKAMLRKLSGFLALLLVVFLSIAAAQQKGKGGGGFQRFGGGTFGNNSLAALAGVEAVQKDVGFSNELAEKLNSLRDDITAARQKEYQTAGIDPQDFRNLTQEQRQKMNQIGNKLNEEFDPKLKSLVAPDQLKRLQEIRLQMAWQNQGPPALLLSDVAAELKLSDDQRQKLNALTMEYAQKQREMFAGGFDQAAAIKMRDERTEKALEVLSEEQKEKLKSLQGKTFDVAQLGGVGGFGGRRGKSN